MGEIRRTRIFLNIIVFSTSRISPSHTLAKLPDLVERNENISKNTEATKAKSVHSHYRDSTFEPENPWGNTLGGQNPLCQPIQTRHRRSKAPEANCSSDSPAKSIPEEVFRTPCWSPSKCSSILFSTPPEGPYKPSFSLAGADNEEDLPPSAKTIVSKICEVTLPNSVVEASPIPSPHSSPAKSVPFIDTMPTSAPSVDDGADGRLSSPTDDIGSDSLAAAQEPSTRNRSSSFTKPRFSHFNMKVGR
ncbi:unnamed protein product [Soboliphyme baturini]|uniref:Uncharacterized protein n=1 Tax=Soboliphyme baturini TaxID=241478 RepID=A0A3P8EU02_9BILA|nr:unnamed protein product [Soboliphyme baturini]